jgi:hypothetical protein
MINQFKEKKLALFLIERRTVLKKRLDTILLNMFEDLDATSAAKLEGSFHKTLEATTDEVRSSLEKSYEISESEIDKYILSLRENGFQSFRESLSYKTREFHTYLVRKFKTLFSKNENGHIRNWRTLKEEDIHELFSASKGQCSRILTSFKDTKIRRTWVPHFPTPMGGSTPGGDDEFGNDLFIEIFTESEYRAVEGRFLDEIENIYNDAIRIHASKEAGRIPKWMWALLIFFMYDDVLGWLRSPFLAYPLVAIVCVVVLLNVIGLGSLPKAVFGMITELFSENLTPKLVRLGLK